MYRVNVWFDGRSYADVSEDFSTKEAAEKFAASYTEVEYPDVIVRVFDLDLEED